MILGTLKFRLTFNRGKTIQSLLGKNIDNPKLMVAEVRVAACLDNHWGGMTITKTK